MTPPEAPATGQIGREAECPPAVLSCPEVAQRLETLRKRADFLRAASALRAGTPGFLLQARARAPEEAAGLARVGFTCSKKLGNAVARNRAKRRLREIARLVLTGRARAGWDYVLVGRPEATASRDFAALLKDIERALEEIHSPRARESRPRPAPQKGRRRGKG